MTEPRTGKREKISGILTTSVKTQLIIFTVITLLGVSYVSAKYVGIGKGLFGSNACKVSAEFPDSGGIFTNAEVTYRGVTVGQVGKLEVIDDGVRVDLLLDDCSNPEIPASAAAVVTNRSVIGEQYVNLIPPNGAGPYLSDGQVIPMSRNKLPVATHTLLINIDKLVRSIDLPSLRTMVSELGLAFNGRGEDLGSLLDSTNALLTAAEDNLPATLALLRSGNTVLSTQLDEASAFASFNRSLKLLTGQFKESDVDIRRLLDEGPGDLGVLRTFVLDNRTDLGITLANLATTGELLVRRKDGLDQILHFYPQLAAGGLTTVHKDYTALAIITDLEPRDCGDPARGQEGYEGTVHRPPPDLSPQEPNVAAHCTAPASSGVNVRGSANVPGGDPISTSAAGVAYPRATTQNTVRLGDQGSSASLGDASWLAMLTAALN